jgi:alkanesulfonate monooxygenase SsuD/methylene tetrahydromethanopterin reductase-like flavin-dependent oxidoreductase (luciferase family)
MHVGYNAAFQNPHDALGDDVVYENELRLCDLAVELGFESLWTVEHHFDDYTMCPDPVQLLTWVAARTQHIRVGTGVIVLPWHDPMRIAENIAQLDNLSDGRLILGLGRGLARIEYEGFRVDMNTSRERLVEYAQVVLEGLERGYLEHEGQFINQPRREIRPRPRYSFRGRTYAAAVSPESMPIMARLGIGLLIIPQKPWEVVRKDFDVYHQVWQDVNGDQPPPAPLCGGSCFVDSSADRAEEMAHRWMGAQYESVLRHYEFASAPHEGVKGYEFYTGITKYIGRHGTSGAVNDYVNLMPYGTPAQVLEKLENIRRMVGMSGFTPGFSYGGMPYDEAERSMRLFVDKVMPELKSWDTEPMAPIEPSGLTGIAAG